MKYEQHFAGKGGWSRWVNPVRKGYKLACCDCGLVHLVQFKLEKAPNGKFIMLRLRRHNRATAAVRRGMKKPRKVA